MKLKSKTHGDTHFIKIIGAVDMQAANDLRYEFLDILLKKPQKVVMDLSKVPTIGSTGIGKILMFFKSLRDSDSVFEIKGIHENLYPFFKAVKLDKVFPISR